MTAMPTARLTTSNPTEIAAICQPCWAIHSRIEVHPQ
jgi:hypothetical protein